MSPRFLIVAPVAVIITAALFFLMRDMIATSPQKPDMTKRPDFDITPKMKDTTSRPKPPPLKPPKLKQPKAQPAKPDFDAARADFPRKTTIDTGPGPKVPLGGGKPRFGPHGMIDGPATPLVRFKPPYPGCGRGVGQVVLEYVVESDGTIRDVKVVSATSSCFARAAQQAAQRWRYRPKVQGGQPVRSSRKQVTVVFQREK